MPGAAPFVSIVIPAYNRRPDLARAVASCLGQQGDIALEVIVVDDGSTDGTADWLAGLNDPRVRWVRHETNAGGAAARNTGIRQARGGLIAFLDSDDAWRCDKLARQLACLNAAGDPAATVCYSRIEVVGRTRSGEVRPARARPAGMPVADYLFVHGGMMQTSSLLLPAALARRVGFDASLRKHQDFDFCLRLEAAGAHFVMAPEPLVVWHHDDRPDRISNLRRAELSERWIDDRRNAMSRAACTAFRLRVVLPLIARTEPRRGLLLLVASLASLALPPSWYARWIAAGVHRRLGRALRALPRP